MATTDLTEAPPLGARTPGPRPAVDVVVPVYNEEADLAPSVRRLHALPDVALPVLVPITIADNASTDATWAIARGSPRELPGVRVVHLDEKGRGRALRAVWSASDARRRSPTWTSTSRPTSPRCCRWSRRSSPGTATWRSARRLARGVARGPRAQARAHLARLQPAAAHARCATRFSDAQCGFKAIRADRRAAAAAARRGHRLVLRHRAARARRARRAAHPRGAGRLGRRPRLAASTSSRPRWTTCAASPASAAASPPGGCRRDAARQLGPAADRRSRRRVAARPAAPVRARSASRARSPTWRCSCCCAPRVSAPGGERSSRCCSPRSPTPRRTAASPSACAAAAGRAPAPGCRGSSCSASALALTRGLARAAHRARSRAVAALEVAVLVAANARRHRRPLRALPLVGVRARDARRAPTDHRRSPRRRTATAARPPAPTATVGAGPRPASTGAAAGPGRPARAAAARPRAGCARRCSALLAATALLYLWDLGASGWANAFYSAAVQAGIEELEGVLLRLVRRGQLHHRRQAAGVAVGDGAVGADLRRQLVEHPGAAGARWASPRSRCSTPRSGAGSAPAAGLIAGAVLALTPVAALMFRFNNPDALLVLLLVAAAYALTRALETRRDRAGSLLAGALVGFAFLTKMLQAFLVRARRSPLVYLVAGADPAAAGASGSCSPSARRCSSPRGWWVAIVELWPGRRPALHRRLAEQQHPRADLRLQRPRPAHRRRDRQRRRRRRRRRRAAACGARPGSSGCSTPSSAARSRGSCPRR